MMWYAIKVSVFFYVIICQLAKFDTDMLDLSIAVAAD